jgi:hypothetical protein
MLKILTILYFFTSAPLFASSVNIYVEDQIATEDSKIDLIAVVYTGTLSATPLGDIDIAFFVNKMPYGKTRTNSSGVARIEGVSTKDFRKSFKLSAMVNTTKGAVFGHAKGYIIDSADKIFISDIDETITDTNTALALVLPNWMIKIKPYAASALKSIGRKRQLIYLTARPFQYKEKTSNWFRSHNLPEAPIIFNIPAHYSESSAQYKDQRISQWLDAGLDIKEAIGDKESDALAYCRNNLNSRIFNKRHYCAREIKSWQQIRLP